MPGLRAAHGDDSDGLTLAHHGYDEVAAKADCTAQLSKGVLRIELDVRYVDDGAFEDRPARPRRPAWGDRPNTTCLFPRGRSPVVCGHHVDQFAIEGPEHTEDGVAQPRSAFDDRIEDRLNVRRRTADDAQNVTRCRLSLESLLCLVKEAHILDGDDGLIGEGLHELDLPFGKRLSFDSPDHDHA